MYVFPGSFRELDLLRVCLINAISDKGYITGVRLCVITPRLAVPELWKMYKKVKGGRDVHDALHMPATQP